MLQDPWLVEPTDVQELPMWRAHHKVRCGSSTVLGVVVLESFNDRSLNLFRVAVKTETFFISTNIVTTTVRSFSVLKMCLVQNDMCCKCKLDTGF